MKSSSNSITNCRSCQHYSFEGRRGGLCGKLDAPVHSTWDACSLATHPFETSWQPDNDFNALLNESFHDTLSLTQKEILELKEIKMRSLSYAK